jgi:hypothetical protein
MEERLHSSFLSTFLDPADVFKQHEFLIGSDFDSDNDWPATGRYQDPMSYLMGKKQFSASLRDAWTYGQSNAWEGYTLRGLELRDVTSDLKVWREYVLGLAPAYANKIWEKLPLPEVQRAQKSPFIQVPADSPVFSRMELKNSKELMDVDKLIHLPFVEFEQGEYFSFREGRFLRPSPKKMAQLRSAREKYIHALKMLDQEISDLDKGPPWSDGVSDRRSLIVRAVRICLSDWAQEAKISELYQPF